MSPKKKFSTPIIFLIPIMLLTAVFFSGWRSIGLARTSDDHSSYLPLIIYPASPTPTLTPTATATHPPEPTNTPVPTPIPGDDWLGYINFLRYQSGLPGVSSMLPGAMVAGSTAAIWSKTMMSPIAKIQAIHGTHLQEMRLPGTVM